MNSKNYMVAAIASVFVAASANAEWERTVSAWDTMLPDQGKVQVSLWGSYTEYEFERVDGDETDATLYLNYGITDNLSVSIAPGYTDWDLDNIASENGFSDMDLLSTYRFQDETETAAGLAVMGRVSLPTGDDDKGLGSGHVEPGVVFICSKDFGAITLVGNVNGDLIIDADEGEEDFLFGGSVEAIYDINEKVSLNTVLSAETARLENGDENVDIGVGSRVKPNEKTFVLGAVYACMTDAYDWSAQLAAGYEF